MGFGGVKYHFHTEEGEMNLTAYICKACKAVLNLFLRIITYFPYGFTAQNYLKDLKDPVNNPNCSVSGIAGPLMDAKTGRKESTSSSEKISINRVYQSLL